MKVLVRPESWREPQLVIAGNSPDSGELSNRLAMACCNTSLVHKSCDVLGILAKQHMKSSSHAGIQRL